MRPQGERDVDSPNNSAGRTSANADVSLPVLSYVLRVASEVPVSTVSVRFATSTPAVNRRSRMPTNTPARSRVRPSAALADDEPLLARNLLAVRPTYAHGEIVSVFRIPPLAPHGVSDTRAETSL